MTALRSVWLLLAIVAPATANAATRYVSTTGTRDASAIDPAQPTNDLCKAIAESRDGDQIWISEGFFNLPQHCSITQRRLTINGGYSSTFKERDMFASTTKLQPKRGAFFLGEKTDDVSFEGLVIDGGTSDAFGNGAGCTDCLRAGYDAATNPPLVALDKAGRARFHHVIFVNAPGGAVAGDGRGALSFDNVAMVNTRPFALKIAGVCGYAAPQCLDLSVKNATVVWTWRDGPLDSTQGGSGIIIGQGVFARIERTVLAYSDRLGVELDGSSPQELAINSLVTFDNRLGDIGLVTPQGLKAQPIAMVSEIVGVRGNGPFGRMERLALPWDPDYLARFLARTQRPFYGARLPVERAFFLSPAPDAGMKAIPGSRLTYEVAVSGGAPIARAPIVEPVVEKDPKDSKKKPPKKPPKKGQKKGKGK